MLSVRRFQKPSLSLQKYRSTQTLNSVATGECDSFESAESWQRETKQMGQVATPESVAAVMAKWVMSAKPHTVLDPAAGLGGLLLACRQLDTRVQLA